RAGDDVRGAGHRAAGARPARARAARAGAGGVAEGGASAHRRRASRLLAHSNGCALGRRIARRARRTAAGPAPLTRRPGAASVVHLIAGGLDVADARDLPDPRAEVRRAGILAGGVLELEGVVGIGVARRLELRVEAPVLDAAVRVVRIVRAPL